MLTIGMGVLLVLIGYFLGLYFFDNATAGLAIAIVVWVILSLVAYFQGDSILLGMSRAKKINRDDHPRLYNVVEEMKIASGLEKMPDIYIIDDPALNAFATGRDPNKASVAITSGLLQRLSRDELQGSLPTRYPTSRTAMYCSWRCAVYCSARSSPGLVRVAFHDLRCRVKKKLLEGGRAGQIVILIVALVFMILAPIFAQLIYFAISRKREYLADAISLYTRYPEGLASALEKLGASTGQLKSANKATAPMYIVNPFRKKG